MGGGDHADVHRLGPGGAHRQHLALGQHAQQPRLQGQWHVADFVEKQGAAIGLGDQAAFAFGRSAREAARQVAEEFAFNQVFRNGGAVHGHKGAAAALAAFVYGLGEVLFAGARFAGDEQTDGGVHQPGHALHLAVQRGVAGRQGGQWRGHRAGALGHRRWAQGRRRGRQKQQALLARQHHGPLVRRLGQHEAANLAERHFKQVFERRAQQGLGIGAQRQLRPPVVAHHPACAVQRQQVVGLHIEKLRRGREAQHPVVPVAVQKGGVFNVVRDHLHQL